MNRNQINYLFGKHYTILDANLDILDCLFQSWISQLLLYPIAEGYIETAKITLPKNIMQKKFHVFHTVIKGCEKFSCASNSVTTSEQRLHWIQLVINVANTSQLSNLNHGNISTLAYLIRCSFCFAK